MDTPRPYGVWRERSFVTPDHAKEEGGRRGQIWIDRMLGVGVVVSHDVAHAAHLAERQFPDGSAVSSFRCAAASPMISMRRMTASCFCVSCRNSCSVVPATQELMSRAASRISRRRPSCSVSIHADGRPKNVLAGVSVGRLLQRSAKNKVHRRADQFFCLTRHVEQFGCGDRHRVVECDEQVDIARWRCFAVRHGAEHLQAANMVSLAESAQPLRQLCCGECGRQLLRGRSVSGLIILFKEADSTRPKQGT